MAIINLSLLLAWLLTDLASTSSVFYFRRLLIQPAPALDTPKVAVLVAIKGAGETTPLFLDALCQQQYPAYRLVFAVESLTDPAFALTTRTKQEFEGKIDVEIVVAGRSTDRVQKAHNLLAALRTLREDDRLVVFADADILPDAAWLSLLAHPVADRHAAASTGYRWQLPTDRRWPSLIVAAADMSITTAVRSARWNLCWGGSVAIDRQALDELDLPTVWSRAASVDLTLAAALRARGLRIHSPQRVLVPSPVSHSWTSLFSFARRQYLVLRTYAPRHWLVAGWTLCLPAIAAAIAVRATLAGHGWTLSFIIASAVLLQIRLLIRRSIADIVLPRSAIAAAGATITFAQWAWPVIHMVNLAAFLASLFGQRFTWAGIRYRLTGKTVTVERRPGEA